MKYLTGFLFISSFCICAFSSDKRSKHVAISEYYENRAEKHIIDGIPALKGQFPWQVLIRSRTSHEHSIRCGGSILNEKKILTAAHCIPAPNAVYRIYVGGITLYEKEKGRTIHTSATVYVHPKYDYDSLENDVGVIVLATSIHFVNDIKPIALPVKGQKIFPDSEVQISGWGYTGSDHDILSRTLSWVYLHTISNRKCSNHFHVIAPSVLCAAGERHQSVCYGDSGGPLVKYINGTPIQVGITSFVSQEGCSFGIPSGFVRTESMLDFINSVSKGNEKNSFDLLKNILFLAIMLLK